jgi:phosphoglycerate dehydrogenase-like enzyme
MKFVNIDSQQFINDEAYLDPLREIGEVVSYIGAPDTIDEAVARAEDADVILFGVMQIPNEMIDRLPKLKIIQFLGTGVATFVDIDYAESKGIKVLNVTGYGSNAVAEYAIAGAFASARSLRIGDQSVRSGGWDTEACEGIEIASSKFGVVGTGSIGRLVAEKAALLGAEVYAFDLYENEELIEKYNVRYVPLQELFSICDIVSLHLIVTPETRGIINRELIFSMKEGSILINVARSELADTVALRDALMTHHLRGAAVDVYDEEPPKEVILADASNVILTPHIGYYTRRATDNSITQSVQSVLEAIKTL